MTSGIYIIRNLVNGKFYVGQATNLRTRKNGHFTHLRGNKHHNPRLQAAYNKYGHDSFIYEILEEVEVSLLTEREKFWIDSLDAINLGYNFKEGGRVGGKPGRIFNWFHVEKSIERNCSVADLARECNVNDKGLYLVSSGKVFMRNGWILKERLAEYLSLVKENKICQRRIFNLPRSFLSIENYITGEIYKNITINEAAKITGRKNSSISCLISGKHKKCGDWMLLGKDIKEIHKRKVFKRSEHFKEAASKWRITIFDSLENKTYTNYRTGQLTELTGIPSKRWMELVSGRKKIMRNRYTLVSAFRTEKASSQAP